MIGDHLRALEAALFAAEAPMTPAEVSTATGIDEPRAALAELAQLYEGRGIELSSAAGAGCCRPRPTLPTYCGASVRSRAN